MARNLPINIHRQEEPMLLNRSYPDIFSPEEARLMDSLASDPVTVRGRTRLIKAGIPLSRSLYLTRGMVGRYCTDRQGGRQFVGIQIPGDFFDINAYVLSWLDHDVVTLNEVEVTSTGHDRLDALRETEPDLYRKLWRVSLIDSSIHRYWIFRLGRLAGKARVANFLIEMFVRLYARGLCGIDRYDLPLSQNELAEITGMTSVHVNRLLGELRLDGLCTVSDGIVSLGNLPALARAGHYSPDYLYLAPSVAAEIRQLLGLRVAMDKAAVG